MAPSGTAYPRATMSAPPPDRHAPRRASRLPARPRPAGRRRGRRRGRRSPPRPAWTWPSTRPTSTSSARPAASTATGRPTSPWSRPSGSAPIPRALATALVEVLERDAAGPRAWPSSWPAPGSSTSAWTTPGCTRRWPPCSPRARTGYARPDIGHGEKVQVEFISANPTGPIHVGNGWWGSYGDALARVLGRSGHVVSREYYVNDTGGQIRTLGTSLLARHRGEEVPEGGYQGQYVTDLAAEYDGPDDVTAAGRWAADRILERIRATLASVGIVFDEWYSQASIEESGAVDETIALLADEGPGLRAGRRHLVPVRAARRRARPGAPQGQRRRHLPGRRPRLPPRQVPDPRLRPGDRRLRRRPPRPGRQPRGRGRRPWASTRSRSR